MTPPRPDTPPELNGTGEKEEITAWLTEGIIERDAMARMDDARSLIYQFSEIPLRITPSLMTTGVVKSTITLERDIPNN